MRGHLVHCVVRILIVMGTRPEVVKLAPVVRALRAKGRRFSVTLCVTAQHRELLDGMLSDFGLRPDVDLDLMRPGQTVSSFLARAMPALRRVIAKRRPDLVLAQGDTATVLAAAMTAFDAKIPFAHVEAGLRSFDPLLPYPEESIRRVADHLARLLFAPTALARRNLLEEGIDPKRVFMTGNTVIDALLEVKRRAKPFKHPKVNEGQRVVAVTLHRRESYGKPLEGIFAALVRAADLFPDVVWVYPVHPAPQVQRAAKKILKHPNILLLEPLGYPQFIALMSRSELIVTDSGGIQEEAPYLGKRVLVLRDKTERPEALGKGGAVLVGTSGKKLLKELKRVLGRRQPRLAATGNFGRGHAAQKIVRALERWERSGGF